MNNQYIPREKILATLEITQPISLFKINKKHLRNKIYKLSQVEKAEIRRQLPATLVIDLTVKQPYLIFYIKDHWWIVDAAGDILNRDDIKVQLPKNIIYVYGLPTISLIDTAVESLKKLSDALYLYLETEKIRIDYLNKDDIKIYLADDVLVKIGENLNLTEKVRNLAQVLQALQNKRYRVEYIDLRAYKTPAVKMR